MKYVINMLIIDFKQFYCLDRDAGSLPTSKIEFFVKIINSWKALSINYCLKESTLDVTGLYDNQITVAAILH